MERFGALLGEVRRRQALPPPAEQRAVLKRAGVSLTAAAGALGVSRWALHQWLKGARPNDEHAERYLALLDALKAEIGEDHDGEAA